jgi:hypothetical protein
LILHGVLLRGKQSQMTSGFGGKSALFVLLGQA